jgi:hypothetical protein
VHNDKKIANNKPDEIIRENEKRTCMLMDVAVLAGIVIFTDCDKGI